MISRQNFELEWIKSVSTKLGRKGDPKMLEKVIYALYLLEQLKANGLNLIFKGGTSLLLVTDPPRRFSIDIDIITTASQSEIEMVIGKIIARGQFTSWESDNERKHVTDAPVSHYKIYYKSRVNQHFGEEPILLDILFGENPYPTLQEHLIAHSWLHQEGEAITIQLPSFESILGDKLTAFAPNTTGILYSKNRPVEIIKQLYDIGFLFELSNDLATIKASYRTIVKEEIALRKLQIDWQGPLEDAIETCFLLALREPRSKEFEHLQSGIRNIVNFIIHRFTIDEAILAGAKTAYLCSLMLNDDHNIKRFGSAEQIRDLEITASNYSKLNKLKKSNPEAFFYWQLALISKNKTA
ncbi:nucleotidyl transferase AbiEii/AbiGii toxin family protein [Mucilaginibacter mali]|uniref:Nucleotidyl transferase AbiEii/AbiGii toxin family protein n=1 Tax=Mucilaginibacter mali TaxID=2740462 RepID=A0A7D4PYP0_9SPHI|nr:nucleotidyl transferase AbiEii/AbiGii toxin family protein [Mucilaginibacter mali]QKJ28346.1 nucleotidyl transferase AbiEii/AbiGii toxin family protein [Mucilaginibacter mali]